MSSGYTYNPDALNPWLAGLAAGGVAAIAGTLLAFVMRSPDEVIANSLTVAVGALLIGLASGWLWRRLQATNGLAAFRWALLGGFVATLVGIGIVDQVALASLIPYAVPIAGMIFVTVAVLTPLFASTVISVWLAIIPALFALGLGVALFGRGNVASGELSLSDLTTTTGRSSAEGDTTTVASDPAVFDVFVISEGTATYTVPETLRGLKTVAVGRSEELTGTITPGGGFTFTLDLTTFVSDQRRRDGFIRDMFGSDPLATFTSNSFELPDVPDGEVVLMTVEGTMTVRGNSREVIWEIEAVKVGAVVSVTGELDILLTDFGVTPPSLAFVRAENEAHLEILFQADGS